MMKGPILSTKSSEKLWKGIKSTKEASLLAVIPQLSSVFYKILLDSPLKKCLRANKHGNCVVIALSQRNTTQINILKTLRPVLKTVIPKTVDFRTCRFH